MMILVPHPESIIHPISSNGAIIQVISGCFTAICISLSGYILFSNQNDCRYDSECPLFLKCCHFGLDSFCCSPEDKEKMSDMIPIPIPVEVDP